MITNSIELMLAKFSKIKLTDQVMYIITVLNSI